MLYIFIMVLIFYRLSFFSFSPEELGAPYWINMEATAITTLAGALLILQAVEGSLIHQILPFLKGFAIFFWAWGSWWLPLLIMLGTLSLGWCLRWVSGMDSPTKLQFPVPQSSRQQ